MFGLVAGFAPAPFLRPKLATADLRALQGDWVLIKQHPELYPGGKLRLHIRGTRGKAFWENGVLEFEFSLNPEAAPKEFDRKYVAGATKGRVNWCIYQVEGNSLLISYLDSVPGIRTARPAGPSDRPKGFFETRAGTEKYIRIPVERRRTRSRNPDGLGIGDSRTRP
jgi:uncharacterized protein (TIGR03067 family)